MIPPNVPRPFGTFASAALPKPIRPVGFSRRPTQKRAEENWNTFRLSFGRIGLGSGACQRCSGGLGGQNGSRSISVAAAHHAPAGEEFVDRTCQGRSRQGWRHVIRGVARQVLETVLPG